MQGTGGSARSPTRGSSTARPAPPPAPCWSPPPRRSGGCRPASSRTEHGVVVHAKSKRRADYGDPGRHRGDPHRAGGRDAQGSEGFPADRQGRTPPPGRTSRTRRPARPRFTQDVRAAGPADGRGRPCRRASAPRSSSSTPPRRKAVPGVVDVVQIPTGVAVLAGQLLGRQAGPRRRSPVEWDESQAMKAEHRRHHRRSYDGAGRQAGHRDPEGRRRRERRRPARPRWSRPPTSSRSWLTPRWSR